jgi:hypothetical protein
MKRRLVLPAVLIILFAALSLGCQEHMTIKMSEAVPPVFTFQASRLTHLKHLSFFIVIELAVMKQYREEFEDGSHIDEPC